MSETTNFPCVVFTDGACSGNPGPGGWGAIVVRPDGEVRELGGGEEATTNNRMEIYAALAALRSLRDFEGAVDIYTDSTYLIRGITQWFWAWRRRGWKTAEGQEVQNRDLWEDLAQVVGARGKDHPLQWKYVRGHIGNPGNERCDRIAVAFSQKNHVGLYRGPLLKYSVDVMDLPESGELPEMRPKAEKKAAHSYVSLVDGVALRHADWPSCEKRVKGRSGAKFKKTSSATDEAELLAAWGVDPDKIENA